jgi:hypothetical protein
VRVMRLRDCCTPALSSRKRNHLDLELHMRVPHNLS